MRRDLIFAPGILLVSLAMSSRTIAAQVVRVGHKASASGSGSGLNLNTISVTASPSTVNFALASGTINAASGPISISSSWLLGLAATVRLYGFFSTTAALSATGTGTDAISSSAVLGQCSTGVPTTFTSFSQAGPFGSGTSLLIFQQAALVSILANRNDQLNLKVDLSQQPELSAGSYTGTLILQIQAM